MDNIYRFGRQLGLFQNLYSIFEEVGVAAKLLNLDCPSMFSSAVKWSNEITKSFQLAYPTWPIWLSLVDLIVKVAKKGGHWNLCDFF